MSDFFIRRPIVAIVIAILTVIVGIIEIGTFAADERERKASVDIDHMGVGELDNFGAVHAVIRLRSPSYSLQKIGATISTGEAIGEGCARVH